MHEGGGRWAGSNKVVELEKKKEELSVPWTQVFFIIAMSLTKRFSAWNTLPSALFWGKSDASFRSQISCHSHSPDRQASFHKICIHKDSVCDVTGIGDEIS